MAFTMMYYSSEVCVPYAMLLLIWEPTFSLPALVSYEYIEVLCDITDHFTSFVILDAFVVSPSAARRSCLVRSV